MRTLHVVACVAIGLLVWACATTEQTRSVEPSGFLGDHSRLESGSGNQSLLRYRNPNTDFSKFDKIVIVPVQIWARSGPPTWATCPSRISRPSQTTSTLHSLAS